MCNNEVVDPVVVASFVSQSYFKLLYFSAVVPEAFKVEPVGE